MGSSERLVDVFSEVAKNQIASITVGEVAAKADWSLDWDRVVYVSYSTTVESLNRKAGTHLEPGCLVGLPPRVMSNDSAPTSRKYTLFVKDGEPIQAVEWMGHDPVFRLDAPFATPNSRLKYENGYLYAEPQ